MKCRELELRLRIKDQERLASEGCGGETSQDRGVSIREHKDLNSHKWQATAPARKRGNSSICGIISTHETKDFVWFHIF